MSSSSRTTQAVTVFRKCVWAYYRKEGRDDLPWRKTRNPYHILVSEMMLQQTQVERVIPFYVAFIKRFPTAKLLAEAPLSEVLKAWQGLGYYSRAKRLQNAAKEIMQSGMPKNAEALERLPGVGSYTAHAISAFAWNDDGIVLETNIRTAIIHHFFPTQRKVSDDMLRRVLTAVLPKGRAREWYSALMDYGAHLKRSGVRVNAKSRHYTKQSKFTGSLREARGAILRELTQGVQSETRLLSLFGDDRQAQLAIALNALSREDFIIHNRGKWRLG